MATLLRAGLDGVRREIDPGPPQQGNTYDLLQEGAEIEKVPDSLGAALDALAVDEVVRSAMPGRLYKVFNHYKRDEWERYLAAVTDWERDEYLEVLPVDRPAHPARPLATETLRCAESQGSSTRTATAPTGSAAT